MFLMLKRPHYIALGLIVVLTLIILNLPGRTAARLKLGVGSVFFPLFGAANASRQMTDGASDSLLSRGELQSQLGTLRKENEQMRQQLARADEALHENERLRKYVGWQQRQPWKLKLASVVLRDPANWWHSVQINLGSRDGVQTNMPVLTPEGALAGKVASVSLTHSQVVLLGDPNCKVAAKVESATHDTGIIGASGPLEAQFVEMSYLSKNAELKPGQKVVTSGDGKVFPANILIGQVVDSHSVEYGLAEVATVKLEANLGGLEEVWVRME
jgi:rod shape-determining protein MreC